MAQISHLQTFSKDQMEALGQVSNFRVTESAGRTQVTVFDPFEGLESQFDLGPTQIRSQDITTRERPGSDTRTISLDGSSYKLDRGMLEDLAEEGGAATSYLDNSGFYGHLTVLLGYEIGGQDYLLASRAAGSGLSVYSLSSSGQTSLVQSVPDTSARALSGVADATVLQSGGQTWIITAAMLDDTVSVWRADGSGRLSLTSSMGFTGRLPVDAPSEVESVTLNGENFVLLGAYGTGSLTVLSLDSKGQLSFVDQVIDSRDTHFDGVSAMAVHAQGNQVLIAIGGNDGGLTLFQMLPGGRLLERDTLEDSTDMALSSIEQLEFVTVGGRTELLVLSARDTGLTRLALDTGTPGITATGRDGTANNDILTASSAGGRLQAGAGDDILRDSSGVDQLYGGSGADIFVFRPDEERDEIRDFDPDEDEIDLSAYQTVSSVQDVSISGRSYGARLMVEGEELRLYAQDGKTLTVDEITPSLRFADDHVIMPPPLAQVGNSDDELFFAGPQADTIDGGSGTDTLTFVNARSGAIVDLANNGANAGSAQGYVLTSIEGLIGSAFDDELRGDERGNNLNGVVGDDTLMGRGGSDWLTPGPGDDHIDGGTGTDMVSFFDYEQALFADMRARTVTSGPDTNTLVNIENLTGSIYGDYIEGDGNANRLRGLGDYDWFVGSYGADTIEGGTGRDMISYVYSPARVVVDLGAQRGSEAHAEGDTYIDVERATGSIYEDLFYGGTGEEDFRGLGGYDWFVGSSGGKDRYDGGTGKDTVAYSSSPSAVSASLVLGRGSTGDAARDLYTDIENLTGSSYDDALTGDNGRNVLRGLWGEDTLLGNGGVDYITGGGSDDYIDGGAGWDVALFSGTEAEYVITTSGAQTFVSYKGSGGDGTDTLLNIEALQFTDDMVYL